MARRRRRGQLAPPTALPSPTAGAAAAGELCRLRLRRRGPLRRFRRGARSAAALLEVDSSRKVAERRSRCSTSSVSVVCSSSHMCGLSAVARATGRPTHPQQPARTRGVHHMAVGAACIAAARARLRRDPAVPLPPPSPPPPPRPRLRCPRTPSDEGSRSATVAKWTWPTTTSAYARRQKAQEPRLSRRWRAAKAATARLAASVRVQEAVLPGAHERRWRRVLERALFAKARAGVQDRRPLRRQAPAQLRTGAALIGALEAACARRPPSMALRRVRRALGDQSSQDRRARHERTFRAARAQRESGRSSTSLRREASARERAPSSGARRERPWCSHDALHRCTRGATRTRHDREARAMGP